MTMMFKKSILIALLACSSFGIYAQKKQVRVDAISTKEKEEIPRDMEQNYDELLSQLKTSLRYVDCNVASDEEVKVADSIYIQRLYALPTEMELAFNHIVRSYIEMYAGRRRQQVSYMLSEGAFYFPLFENILDKEGMPLELKYLPVIESALNPIARSRVGATGLWQFMAGTGKMYKLEINSLVDERRDPLKSTEAAVKYLKDMYGVYKDWNLVIAAYNCGPGNVNKAIRRSGGKRDYWEIYPYLPKETRGYVPAFIAATYIMNYYEQHNICPAENNRSVSLDTLGIDKYVHFEQIASVLDINISDIRKYNPQFTSDIIPGDFKPYSINLPYNDIAGFITNRDTIMSYNKDKLLSHRKVVDMSVSSKTASGGDVVYRVKKGDTLSQIAKRYGVTVTQIKSWNNLKSSDLSIGRRLSIYGKTVAVKTPAREEVTEPIEIEESINLKSVELLVEIDPTYINYIMTDYLTKIETSRPLPTLHIIGGNEEKGNKHIAEDNSRYIYHKTGTGETIKQIAARYHVNTKEIVDWNRLKEARVNTGQRLLIQIPDREMLSGMAQTDGSSNNTALYQRY